MSFFVSLLGILGIYQPCTAHLLTCCWVPTHKAQRCVCVCAPYPAISTAVAAVVSCAYFLDLPATSKVGRVRDLLAIYAKVAGFRLLEQYCTHQVYGEIQCTQHPYLRCINVSNRQWKPPYSESGSATSLMLTASWLDRL